MADPGQLIGLPYELLLLVLSALDQRSLENLIRVFNKKLHAGRNDALCLRWRNNAQHLVRVFPPTASDPERPASNPSKYDKKNQLYLDEKLIDRLRDYFPIWPSHPYELRFTSGKDQSMATIPFSLYKKFELDPKKGPYSRHNPPDSKCPPTINLTWTGCFASRARNAFHRVNYEPKEVSAESKALLAKLEGLGLSISRALEIFIQSKNIQFSRSKHRLMDDCHFELLCFPEDPTRKADPEDGYLLVLWTRPVGHATYFIYLDRAGREGVVYFKEPTPSDDPSFGGIEDDQVPILASDVEDRILSQSNMEKFVKEDTQYLFPGCYSLFLLCGLSFEEFLFTRACESKLHALIHKSPETRTNEEFQKLGVDSKNEVLWFGGCGKLDPSDEDLKAYVQHIYRPAPKY